jgi:hypothetical protein
MKKIYKAVLLALISNATLAQSSFFVPTNYRGAFDAAPTNMWTDTWTNWDPQNTVYPAYTVDVTSSISVNTTWTSGNVYRLSGQIYVKAGATLTIQPGTIILGNKASTGAGLFIEKGCKLIAQGTVAQPIVFTSDQAPGSRGAGDWGGIILMGKASNNNPGGIANVEGIAPSTDTEYGGGTSPDDNDNSGILKYVRIEFPGYVYAPNKEINGLTFGAVGSGTTIDYIQVSFSNDDSYEWFGGTVGCRHLVAYRGLDDDFDTDNGFSGHLQFALSVRDPAIADNPAVSTSEGFESDNDPTGSTATPQTSARMANITIIGPYRGVVGSAIATGYRRAARIRRNSALKIYNSVLMDHQRGIHIDGSLAEGNATGGLLQFRNNILAGNSPGFVTEVNAGSTFGIDAWFVASMNDSLLSTSGILVNPYNYLTPDYRPMTGSPALSNYDFTNSTLTGDVLFAPTVSNISYCVGDVASALTATGTNVSNTLNWYTVPTGGTASTTAPTPGTTSAGTFNYYVSQMNSDGYEGPRATITITVHANPTTPTISAGGPTSFCTGGNVVLTSSYSSGNMWSTSATTNSITVSSSGTYTVTETDVNGCMSTSAPTTVSVSSAPVPTVSVAGPTTLCAGQTVTLTSSTSDTYLWSNGATTSSITVSTAGTYTVTTTNSNPCNGVGTSSGTTVTVNANPTAAGGISGQTGMTLTFSNTSTGATSYNWDFGDLSNSSATTPTHAYATSGTYTVTLVAINASGCTDTTTITVTLNVGISEIKTVDGVNLYPNPTSQEAFIEVNLNESANVAVMIYDMSGKVIANPFNGQMNIGKNIVKVDASEFTPGVYFTTIVSGNAKKTLKLVVTR